MEFSGDAVTTTVPWFGCGTYLINHPGLCEQMSITGSSTTCETFAAIESVDQRIITLEQL